MDPVEDPEHPGDPKHITYKKTVHTNTTPEHQCPNEATALRRDLKEVNQKGILGTSFKIVKELPFCEIHAENGVIEFLDGRTGQHARQSVSEYSSS